MENRFSLWDVVWARARKPKSEIFWPAQVIEGISAPTPSRSSKKIIASVRFLGEDTEEDVKNPKDIKRWDCEEQPAFIQKGRNSLKDSNAKIAFNKGIKEARKLVKEENNNADKEEKTSANSTPVKFVDDNAIPWSTTSPQKRGRKRSAEQEAMGFNDNINQDKACRNIDFEGTSCSKRKSPRKLSASESTNNVCNGTTTNENISNGSEGKLSQRKSPRKPPEKVIENKSKSFKEKSNQGKRKRGKSPKKDSLRVLCENLPPGCLDSNTDSKLTLDNSVKQKATKQLFPKMDTETTSYNCEEINIENGHGINLSNGKETAKKTEDSDSDESSDRELMETVLDSSPSSKNLKFALNDVVWAKLYRDPYWPAVVKRIQKKPKKIYVKFLGYNEKRSFSCKKLQPFACDADKRQEFISEGSKHDPSYFQNAFTEAEDLVRKKALGINIEPDDDEEFEMVDTEETKTQEQQEKEPASSEYNEIPEEEKQDVRRSKRSKKQVSKYNRDMLSYIREAKPILREILEEKRPCERHKIFTTGRSKQRSSLKHQSGFGPISDSDLENEIVEILTEFYNEVSSKKNDYSKSSYVMDVWLPEAIIYAIQKIDHVDRKKAELVFNKGTSECCDFTHEELFHQLKEKQLSDEDRQAVIERAERLLQMQTRN